MDIRMLRYILEISKTKNLTMAANNLYISQPALSKALRNAEDEMGCKLFYRDGNVFCPTDSGQIVLEYAESITQQFLKMEGEITSLKKLMRGKVSLGLPPIVEILFFPQIMLKFRQQYPGIEVEILEFGGMELATKILCGKVDIALGIRPISVEGLSEIPVYDDEISVGVRGDNPLSLKKSITLGDLQNIPLLTFGDDSMVYARIMEEFRSAGIQPHFDIRSTQCDFIIKMTELMNRVCIIPRPALEHYRCGDIVIRPFSPAIPWELCIFFRKNSYIPYATKTLLLFIQQEFSKIKRL